MTLAVARVGDAFIDGDSIASGSPDVFINNIPVARLSDPTTGHVVSPHAPYPPTTIMTGSGLFFANNLPVARMTDAKIVHVESDSHPTPHNSIIAVGSGDVFSG